MSGDTVMLVDAATGDVVDTIESGPAPHEVAVSADGRWAIISNYGDRSQTGNSLTVIDITGKAETRRVDLGIYERPHGIAFLNDDKTVAVTSEAQGVVLFVEIDSGDIVATAATEQKVSHMVATESTANRFVYDKYCLGIAY